jgi:hypothetical protein
MKKPYIMDGLNFSLILNHDLKVMLKYDETNRFINRASQNLQGINVNIRCVQDSGNNFPNIEFKSDALFYDVMKKSIIDLTGSGLKSLEEMEITTLDGSKMTPAQEIRA